MLCLDAAHWVPKTVKNFAKTLNWDPHKSTIGGFELKLRMCKLFSFLQNYCEQKSYFELWKLWNFTLIQLKKIRENSLHCDFVMNTLISRHFCKKILSENSAISAQHCVFVVKCLIFREIEVNSNSFLILHNLSILRSRNF